MRIIAGRLGGRQFDSPRSSRTHPMSDKLRGALFNILGDIEGLTVLDAFAGSGALSFEAVSRGASEALAIDIDRNAQRVISKNIDRLGLQGQVRLVKAAAGAWLESKDQGLFDIVLCDPPYDDRQPALLRRLSGRVRPDGIFVVSWPAAEEPPDGMEGFVLLERRAYGDAALVFYRRIA